jgi:hypothetical protein
MPQLHLPAEHTDADLVLATQVAEALDASELYVAWSGETGSPALPEVPAVVREPLHPVADAASGVLASLAALVNALRGRRS